MKRNPYAPPRAAVADPHEVAEVPALWNPARAASLSVLFTPVFGAALQMKNWEAMGDARQAATARAWMIGSMAFIALGAALGIFAPHARALDLAIRMGGFGVLVAWYLVSGRTQMREVEQRYGKDYTHRGFGMPVLYALLGLAGFFALVFGLAVLAIVVGRA